MTVVDLKKRVSRSLFEAGKLRCPHDKQLHDILTYKRFDLPNEFESQLNVVLKCIFCGHLFSPCLSSSEMKIVEEAFENDAA